MARWRSAHVSTSTDRIGCELEPTAVERLSPSPQPNAMRTAGVHARARQFRGTRARACRTVQVDGDVEVDDVAVGEGPTVGDAATDGWMDGWHSYTLYCRCWPHCGSPQRHAPTTKTFRVLWVLKGTDGLAGGRQPISTEGALALMALCHVRAGGRMHTRCQKAAGNASRET
jgi:hypothetical protein